MKTMQDWEDAVSTEQPVVIQAGASWCGPCKILKPKLIEAVKQHEGKVSFMYVDIDEHSNIAQMLEVSVCNQ